MTFFAPPIEHCTLFRTQGRSDPMHGFGTQTRYFGYGLGLCVRDLAGTLCIKRVGADKPVELFTCRAKDFHAFAQRGRRIMKNFENLIILRIGQVETANERHRSCDRAKR
jgi:hypothetical protein